MTILWNASHPSVFHSKNKYVKCGVLWIDPPTTEDIFGCSHVRLSLLIFAVSFFTYFDRALVAVALDDIQMQLFNDNWPHSIPE